MKQKLIITDFWNEYEITEDEILCFNLKTIRIWFQKKDSELLISHVKIDNENSEEHNTTEVAEELEWSRWAVEKDKIKIRVLPVFPDRPVVVKPELAFRLTDGTKARVYVRVPIWIRIELVGRKSEILLELPSVSLSNSWFGNFMKGELCYWISSGARRTIEPDPNRPYLAICPIQIIDDTDEELFIEKLCLRVQNLTMFYNGKQLWSDETKVYYKGITATSQIEVSHAAPKECLKSQLLSKPRHVVKRGITAKTFSTLRELPGMGFFSS